MEDETEIQPIEPDEGKPVVALLFGLTYMLAAGMFLWLVVS